MTLQTGHCITDYIDTTRSFILKTVFETMECTSKDIISDLIKNFTILFGAVYILMSIKMRYAKTSATAVYDIMKLIMLRQISFQISDMF